MLADATGALERACAIDFEQRVVKKNSISVGLTTKRFYQKLLHDLRDDPVVRVCR